GTLAHAGVITTRGFEDTLFAMRGGYGRWSGLTEDEKRNPVDTEKPEPIVPRSLVAGVRERMDARGTIQYAAREDDIEGAVQALLDDDVEAIGVSTLWSFANPATEGRRGREAPEAGSLLHALERDRAGRRRVRADVDRCAQCEAGARRPALPRQPAAPARRARVRRAVARRAGVRRAAARGRGCGAPGRDDRVRPGVGPCRLAGARRADGSPEHHRCGHGRHDVQGR